MKEFLHRLSSEPTRILLGAVSLVLALVLRGVGAQLAALVGMLAVGFPIFGEALRGILRRDLLDEKLLMTLASVGAFLLGEYTEGIAVLLFFVVGEYFEHRAVSASRRSIAALMDICPDRAAVLRNGEAVTLDADEVEIGETLVISPGERIALDCEVLSGEASVNVAAITGEPLPIAARCGTHLPGGALCLDGRLVAKCESTADGSAAARILSLVEQAQESKSREESFITKFSRVYTPTVVLLAAFLGGLLPLLLYFVCGGPIAGLGMLYRTWVHRALIFLVVSCPCALVISVPLSFFGGIGGAASVGILFKGGNRFHAVAKAKTVCFDKTGTLTAGECRILSFTPLGGFGREEVLSLAASAESPSSHPIARAIVEAYGKTPEPPSELREYAGRGVVATALDRRVAVGRAALAETLGYPLPTEAPSGATIVWVEGEPAAVITLGDLPRPEARAAVSALSGLGVSRVVMLTGDGEENALAVARELGIREVRHSLLPEDKYRIVEELSKSGGSPVLFVGDGINDAPVLTRADVGVAMGGIGSDAAIEASDAVITSDNPLRVADAVRIARKTVAIAKENIVFAITVKLAILILSATGLVESMWLAVFADVGVAVLAILNAIRAVRRPRLLDPKEI
jgi:Cd2+/Zn2+-exporting ATPase